MFLKFPCSLHELIGKVEVCPQEKNTPPPLKLTHPTDISVMPDILRNTFSRANDASVPSSATADTNSRACKRSRPSPPHKTELPPQAADLDKMDVVIQPTNTLRDEDEASHASSDWGDWADAQVAQSSSPERVEASSGEGTPGEQGGPPSAEEDAWIRSMMDQGTDRSVVQGSDSRAWDYVLQMAVESEAQGANDGQLPHMGEWNAAEVRGAAVTEFVSRWLHRCLPISLPALRAFGLVTNDAHRKNVGYKQPGRSPPAGGWVVVDKLADPSSVAIVSRSAEQAMHRITLLSLSANAGAALAADVVQPGAAGLIARGTRDPSAPPNHFGSRETDPGHGGSHRGVGVVFESLDSRILEVALVSAMGRLGLSVTERTRSGLWRLPPGATLTTPDASTMNALVTPLTEEDASFITRSVSAITPDGAVFRSDNTSSAEATVRGLIHRNPSVGVRRNGHLVAWCLSFDNGLAGAIHVTEAEVLDVGCTATEVVVLLLQPLLSGTGASQTPTPCQGVCRNPSRVALASSSSGEGEQDASIGGAFGLTSMNTVGGIEGCALAGVVVDEAWPFLSLLRKIGLERVCDADWVRFEPNSSASCGGIAGGVAPLPAVMFGW